MIHTMYRLEIENMQLDQVQEKIQILMNQCKQIEQRYTLAINQEMDRLYQQQYSNMQHLRKNILPMTYQ